MAAIAPLPTKCNITDSKLGELIDDPRNLKNLNLKGLNAKGKGSNTESFDPSSTLVRPDLRVRIGSNKAKVFNKPIKHDDVIIVPDFFCEEEDLSLYYKLIEEFRNLQATDENSKWLAWHEGCHLVSKAPEKSETFQKLVSKVSKYFKLKDGRQGVRFNWYKDSSDWKPFHHDSAAFNEARSKLQNFTVGISLGSERELAFLHAKNKSKVYFPQSNGMMFAFGRDVNIKWKHAINALPLVEQNGLGRISIIVWGLCDSVIEEPNSPPMIVNRRKDFKKTKKPRQNREKNSKKKCRMFNSEEGCKFGESCKFSHE